MDKLLIINYLYQTQQKGCAFLVIPIRKTECTPFDVFILLSLYLYKYILHHEEEGEDV